MSTEIARAAAAQQQLIYSFGDFRLNVTERALLQRGHPIAISPKCLDLLILLIEKRGRLVTKEELLRSLWPDTFVQESNLTQNIYTLRRILGPEQSGNKCIQTIARRGYKFIAAVTEVETASAESAAPLEYWKENSPFRGLRAFEPKDAWLFFGRDTNVEELLERLARAPTVAVVGNSGCGKSSLVRAGLIPALLGGRFREPGLPASSWRIALFRPSTAPFDYLAETLPSQLAPELSLSEQAQFIEDCGNRLPEGGDGLRNAVSALVNGATREAGETRVLLMADQFEEIFTLTADRDTRNRYIDTLLAAASWDRAVPIHLVLVLRADFYAQALEHPELSRAMGSNLYNVPRMEQGQLRETIEKRLELSANQAESGLIDRLIADVGDAPGNLALLEHVMGQLWEQCGGAGCTLTSKAYSEIGCLQGALGHHADKVYEKLAEEELRGLAQRIFLELVHIGEDARVPDSRRRVRKADLLFLGSDEKIEQVLGHLASSRLICISEEGDAFVEVSHEALIHEWPRLRDWLNENREELRLRRRLLRAAEEWAAVGRDPEALLRGMRLAEGEEWLARSTEVPPIVREFLDASVRAREEAERKELAARQREAVRRKAEAVRLRWFSACLAVLLLVTAAAAWRSYQLQRIEKSRAWAAQSESMRVRDHGQALTLALSAWRYSKTAEARLAVTEAFPQPIVTLNHDADVESATFSPDGQKILTASDDHTAKLWSFPDGKPLAVLRGHTDKVIFATFSRDGDRIATVSLDRTARVWDAANGSLLATLRGHTDKLMSAQFSPDGQHVVTASWDKTARVWNAADGRVLAILQGHRDVVAKAIFSPDAQRIVTASFDGTARVWSGEDYRLVGTLTGHDGEVASVEFSSDGRRVITAGTDQTARLWSSTDWHLVAILRHGGVVLRATFSPDSRRVVTACVDKMARVWDSENGSLLLTLQGHNDIVYHATFSADGRLILTDSQDRTARVWDSRDGILLLTLPTTTEGTGRDRFSTPWFSTFSPDGRFVVTALDEPIARLWHIAASATMRNVFRDYAGVVRSIAFSPDRQLILTAHSDRVARVWDASGNHLLLALQGHKGDLCTARFSPDGQRILTASVDATARIWNTADGRLVAVLQGHTDAVSDAEFSPDGRRVVTASLDQTARIWDASSGRQLAILIGHSGGLWMATFSPDGQRIVTASLDHTARLWNAADRRLVATLSGHRDRVYSARFSPDGLRVVTASADHTARIWNGADGRLLASLQDHTDQVGSAAFSPDGQHIVTASRDRTARIWDSANGRLLATLGGHTGEVWAARFSSDGRRILTSSLDATARVWDSSSGSLLLSLNGHGGAVYPAAFLPDDRSIITTSHDQTARVWTPITLRELKAILQEK